MYISNLFSYFIIFSSICFLDYYTQERGLAKIGPWGGNGGTVHGITVAPHRLESVTICSGTIVDSLMFTYLDNDGRRHTSGPWGRSGVSARTETVRISFVS